MSGHEDGDNIMSMSMSKVNLYSAFS